MNCKNCGHDMKSHYCEIVQGTDLHGNPNSPSKTQQCHDCGISTGSNDGKCWAVVKDNLDINTPILNFWAWKNLQGLTHKGIKRTDLLLD